MKLKFNTKAQLSQQLFKKNIDEIPTRQGYGEGLVEAGKQNKNVVVLCCDLTDSTKSNFFKKKYPERFIEIGVAEQNMAGVAAGLALEGKIPFISSYAVFSPGRNWDQIRVAVCYSRANVKIAGAHSGISVGPDGATHQALEDIAITRVLPHMIVLAPSDYIETTKATIAVAKFKGPVYIRFARNATPVFTTKKTPFGIGKAEVFLEGDDITIIGCGPVLYEAFIAAKMLAQEGITAEVINCHTIKPIDKTTILRSCSKTKAIVTVEEHQITGGLGGAVAELISEHMPVPLVRVGVQDRFGESGKPEELFNAFGLTHPTILKASKKALRLKKRYAL